MSSTLYWKPVVEYGNALPDRLKHVLGKQHERPISCTLDGKDIKYLQGLDDCDIPGAFELIAAIVKHDLVAIQEIEE